MYLFNFLHKCKKELLRYVYLADWLIFDKPLFAKIGKGSVILNNRVIKNHQNITIGDNFSALERFRIEAITKFNEQIFTPKIVIGNNVTFNTDIHIGCIDYIEIGDNVVGASRIFISDHLHGDTSFNALSASPNKRALVSKGSVIIKNNVLIGEGVCILPGVTIGKNTIIGANAVVTKSFPDNAVIAGNPAKLIKIIN